MAKKLSSKLLVERVYINNHFSLFWEIIIYNQLFSFLIFKIYFMTPGISNYFSKKNMCPGNVLTVIQWSVYTTLMSSDF